MGTTEIKLLMPVTKVKQCFFWIKEQISIKDY